MPGSPACRPFEPRYPLETERLLLRPLEPGDLDAFLSFYSREDVVRYLYTRPLDREQMREWLAERAQRSVLREEGDFLKLATVLRATGEVIGEMTLIYISAAHAQGELGFVFHPDHHGQGYALEASRLLLAIGFEQVGFRRIVGRLDSRNTASARVLERLGMRREAHLLQNEYVKGEWTDETVYAMLATEWGR